MPILKPSDLEWTQVSEKLKIKHLLKGYPLAEGPVDVGIANWPHGEAGTVHVHEWQDEVYIILRGKGRVIFEGKEYIVEPGDMMHAASGEAHATVEGLTEGGVDLFFALLPVAEEKK